MKIVPRIVAFVVIAVGLITPLDSALASGPPSHLWSQRFGDAEQWQTSSDVALDTNGNIILVGNCAGTADFGGGALTQMYLASFNSMGVHLWSKQLNLSGYGNVWHVEFDGSGAIFLAGEFEPSIDLGGGPIIGATGWNIFLAKFDGSGNHQWSKGFGSTNDQTVIGMALDSAGNAIITGYLYNAVDFGGGVLTSAGATDAYIAKFNSSGQHLWSKRFGDANTQQGSNIACDAFGGVFFTGAFRGSVDLGGGVLTSAGINDVFLAKFDASGFHQWSARFGDSDEQSGSELATDAGDVIVAGHFRGTINFGGNTLTAFPSSDTAFLAKFDGLGTHTWSVAIANLESPQMAIGHLGDITICGTTDGIDDIVLARYASSGEAVWRTEYGDEQWQSATGLALDESENIVLAATFSGSVDFGGGPLTSAGNYDIALAKLGNENPIPVLISQFDAIPRHGHVKLAWTFSSDEALKGFILYRGQGQAPSAVIATGDAQTTTSYTDASVQPGVTYSYELVIRTVGGDEFRSPVVTASVPAAGTTLAQNFPNPFNPQTTIEYTVRAQAVISIEIFDVSGARIRLLEQGVREAGSYRVEWDGRDDARRPVSGGVYWYRLSGVKGAETRKMVLVK